MADQIRFRLCSNVPCRTVQRRRPAPKSRLPAPARAAVEGSEELLPRPWGFSSLVRCGRRCAGAARHGCCLEMLMGPLFGCLAGPSASSANAVHECVGSVLESWLIFAARETSTLHLPTYYTRDCSGNNEKRIRIAIVRWWGHGGILLPATRLLCRRGFLFCGILCDWQQGRTAPGPRSRGGKWCDCRLAGPGI